MGHERRQCTYCEDETMELDEYGLPQCNECYRWFRWADWASGTGEKPEEEKT